MANERSVVPSVESSSSLSYRLWIASKLFCISLTFILSLPEPLMACNCTPAPVCEKVARASVVFAGRVLDVVEGVEKDSDKRMKARFTVQEAFKGLTRNEKEVEVGYLPEGDCAVTWSRGQRYLLYARLSANQLMIKGDCNGTVFGRDIVTDLQYLRAWVKGETPTLLRGVARVEMASSLPTDTGDSGLSGVEVLVSGQGRKYRATTDGTGDFKMEGLVPGSYEVSAQLPGYESTLPNYRVTVKKGNCAKVTIGMESASTVSGILYDETGQPASGMRLELAPWAVGDLLPLREVLTDGEGHYEFRKVPSGNYFLGVNLGRGLNSRTPYATRFYPGVNSRDQAVVLGIEGGQELPQYDFQLQDRRSTRTILAQVVWWDGRPVSNASVECRSDPVEDRALKMDWQSRYADGQGKVQFNVLTERDYAVSVDQLIWIRSSLSVQERQAVHIPAGKDPVRVQLSVPRSNDRRREEAPVNMSRFNE